MILKSAAPAYGGYTIAREEKIILIRGAIPGEVVETVIEENRRDYAVASVTQVVEPSEHRIEPQCPVFGSCGGCHLQFMTYDRQVTLKEEVLLDSLSRQGGIEMPLSPSFRSEPWRYRLRSQFKVSKEGEIGFYRESSRDVVSFDECPLLHDGINSLFRKIRETGVPSGVTGIHVAGSDRPLVMVRSREKAPGYADRLLEMGAAGVAWNDELAAGDAETELDLGGLRYTVSPWTFFQAHWELNRRVVEFAVSQLQPLDGKSVLDLYAGAGNFSLPIASQGAAVTAVEEHPAAVEDGMRNAQMNAIRNCRFKKSTAEKFPLAKKYDIIVLDPPRPGLTNEVRKKLLDRPPDTILYLSCNPATLARDLKVLSATYVVESVRMVDFFPQTYHLEALAVLRAR
ncbi:MAG: class I SAM-dependent RNA methyltransferase [Thermodesulfovibrionales bacterium]